MTRRTHRSRVSAAVLLAGLLACGVGIGLASPAFGDDSEIVMIELPPPGVCAQARTREFRTPPVSFQVTGTAASLFNASDVGASGPQAGGVAALAAPPPPMPRSMPARNPCDGGGACPTREAPPIVESPVVGTGPPGVP